MKGLHPRFIALLGVIVDAVAFGSLFLTYATITYFGDAVYPPNHSISQAVQGPTGWTSLFDFGPPPVSWWYWVIPILAILSIVFPFSLYLTRLLLPVHLKLFLLSSFVSLPGVGVFLLWDIFLMSTSIKGNEKLFTLQPAAWLLLPCLCANSGCSIILWQTLRRILRSTRQEHRATPTSY